MRLHLSTAFWTLIDCEAYSISSKGFLPIVVDIRVIWIKLNHFLIPKMPMFTLAISCLTTPNLPWFMDLTFQVLCNIVLYSNGLYFHHWWHSQLGIVLALAPSLHSFWSYFSSSILGTYRPGEFLFQYPIILPFHTVHGVLKARILKWFAISFTRVPLFVRTLHHDLSLLSGPTWHGS